MSSYEAPPRHRFAALVRTLGGVCDETIVRMNPAIRRYVCDWRSVPFHTDAPHVDLVAWRCEVQGEQDGANLLVDPRQVLRGLALAIQSELRRTSLKIAAEPTAPHREEVGI